MTPLAGVDHSCLAFCGVLTAACLLAVGAGGAGWIEVHGRGTGAVIRTWVDCPCWGVPCVCAMFGLTYDFCACESSSAVTKPDLNSNTTFGVGNFVGACSFNIIRHRVCIVAG